MSRARSVADLGNQNVLDLNASAGTLKVGAGATIENTGEAQFAGIITATGADFSGAVSVGGVLTYEDVTSVDSVGVITARAGLVVTGGTIPIEVEGGPSEDSRIQFSRVTSEDVTINSGWIGIPSWDTDGLYIYGPTSSSNEHAATYTEEQWRFFTAGSEKLRILSGGNVGIGTTNPIANLHVKSSGATEIKSESTGDNALININNSSAVPWILTQRSDTANAFSFRYSGNNYVNISTSGNVGIGITNPGQKLTVKGTTSLMATNSTNQWMAYTYTDNSLRLNYNGVSDDEVVIDSTGVFRVNESGTISGSATPKLFVRTASSTDTTDIVAKFGNNNTTTSSESLIAMSAGYSLTANDTEGHVYFGAQRAGNGNKSGFIVKTWDGTNFNRHFRVDYLGGTNIMRTQNGGTHDTGNTFDHWRRIGEFRNVTMGWRGHLTLMGAQSYSAGSNTSGNTIINLCIVNNNTVTGHFYGVSGQTGTVKGVAHKYDAATDILEIWVQPVQSYAGLGVIPNASFGGWYGDNTNTASNTLPSGASALSSHLHFQTLGTTALTIDQNQYVTKPANARFIAKLTADTTYNPSGFGNHVDYDSTAYDIGGNFTTSGADQGLFTAPVAGQYHFNAAAYSASTQFTQSWFVINGARAPYTDWVLTSTGEFVQNSIGMNLAAGDKVGFHPHKGGTSSFTVNANVHHTWFSGYLVG